MFKMASNTDAVFELIAHGELENWASLSQFHQGRHTTAPRLCSMCRSTVMSAENGRHVSRRQTERCEHEFQLPSLCSPVVAVADCSGNVHEAWMPVVLS